MSSTTTATNDNALRTHGIVGARSRKGAVLVAYRRRASTRHAIPASSAATPCLTWTACEPAWCPRASGRGSEAAGIAKYMTARTMPTIPATERTSLIEPPPSGQHILIPGRRSRGQLSSLHHMKGLVDRLVWPEEHDEVARLEPRPPARRRE